MLIEFEDIFELLETVRTHKLGKGECIMPANSVRSTHVGYLVADSKGPATRWTISVADLKASCSARTSAESQDIFTKMRAYQERRKLMEDLRSGKLELEERPHPEGEISEGAEGSAEPTPESSEEELERFVASLES